MGIISDDVGSFKLGVLVWIFGRAGRPGGLIGQSLASTALAGSCCGPKTLQAGHGAGRGRHWHGVHYVSVVTVLVAAVTVTVDVTDARPGCRVALDLN